MSFILDALKKSENERQRTIGPSLADAPVRHVPSERPWWVIAVGALLVVNLGVLTIVLTRNKSEPPAPVAATVLAQPAQQPAPLSATRSVPPSPTSTSPAVRSLAEEAGASSDPYYDLPAEGIDPAHADLGAAANVPAGPPIVSSVEPPAVAPLGTQPTFQARDSRPNAYSEMLPTAGSLVAGGTALPEMRLDIHVYSDKPAERFVFINMRKYTEGQVIAEGPTLERITPDGAILNRQGLRFLLPRQ